MQLKLSMDENKLKSALWPCNAILSTSKLPVQSWTKNHFYLFPMKPDDKTGFQAKKRFLMAILKFSDETWSRFSEPIFLTNHYHETWKFAVNILKISQLVIVLLTKNQFSAAILNFYNKTWCRFFEPIFFTNHYHQTWKFAIRILKISQLVLVLSTKNRFSAAILNFNDQTGSRFFEPVFFTNQYHQTWKFAV